MTHVIRQWIQEKLGIIINLLPATFCGITRDGYLLSKILRSYEIINEDQFQMVYKTDSKDLCYANFNCHIIKWLKTINITIDDEELNNIVEGKGLASLSLFYRMFLELHEKDCLTFIAKNRLNEKLRPQISKYTVTKVSDNPFEKLNNLSDSYRKYVENSYDVVHWLQDRFEMVVGKCKVAREEYLSLVRSSDRKISTSFSTPLSIYPHYDFSAPQKSPTTVDLTYEELMEERRKCKTLEPNVPEAKLVLEKIRSKLKQKAKSETIRKESERYIRRYFWNRIMLEETKGFHRSITETMLKQSLYEKQMLRKLLEVKQQKQVMMYNKKIISDQIVREKEALALDKALETNAARSKREFMYLLEKERASKLHKTINKAITRLKEEKTTKLCRDVVNALCEVAVKHSEYHAYFGEPPSRRMTNNWNRRIVAGQTLDETDIPIDAFLNVENGPPKADIDENDFDSYMRFEWPWLLSATIQDELLYDMDCGMNVLGRMVHLLLGQKYQLETLPSPPDLPNIRVCVNGLPDVTCLPMLSKLMQFRKVLVIELQDAVNHCIGAYTEESSEEPEDKMQNEKMPIKGKKIKAFKKPKRDIDSNQFVYVDKVLQTPTVYPCQQTTLSTRAELGKKAEKQLSEGNALTDVLLISMFIEYLKYQTDIEGWVLVNYPATLEQAILLEEGLSGLNVPPVQESKEMRKRITDIVDISERTKKKRQNARYSRLVNDPVEQHESGWYDSVLTAFINIRSSEADANEETSTTISDETSDEIAEKVTEAQGSAQWSFRNASTEGIDDNAATSNRKEVEVTMLEKFYTEMGCNYLLYYGTFEYATVKRLAELVLGVITVPPQSSIELFGDTVRYIESEKIIDYRNATYVKSGEKVERERIERVVINAKPAPVSSYEDKRGKKEKTAKSVVIIHEDKFTQIPEQIIIEIDDEEVKKDIKPGESGWKYLNLIIAKDIGAVITNFWEHIEEIYTNDMTQIFFIKNKLLDALLPYTRHAKQFLTKHATKPDDRQIYLVKFQDNFNKFDSDFRRDNEFKSEMHRLTNELKDNLFDMCKQKMTVGEREMRSLVNQNWGSRHLIELANNYIRAFQLELDHHFDTLVFVNDYFTGLIAQVPSEDDIVREAIPKLDVENKAITNAIDEFLINTNMDEFDGFVHQLQQTLISFYQTTLSSARKRQTVASSGVDKMKLAFSLETDKGKTKKARKGTKSAPFEIGEKVLRNQEKIFDEWSCVLKGESARLEIRFELLKIDMLANVNMLIETLKKIFYGAYKDMKTRYDRETHSVREACGIILLAIENEVPIPEELLFIDDTFAINAETIFFEPRSENATDETPDSLLFTLTQLTSLVNLFLDLSPDGFLPRTAFTYILHNILSTDEDSIVPADWKKLSDDNIKTLTQRLFDDRKFINWKDFVIYNLPSSVPSEPDIIHLRDDCLKFDPECTGFISKLDYERIRFRFEEENNNVKTLLYEMYQKNNCCDYTALLFDLCKAESTQRGVAKALSVVCGRPVCWNEAIGRKFVEETLTKRKVHEEEVIFRKEQLDDHAKFVETIMDGIIDRTIEIFNPTLITEDAEEKEDRLVEKISQTTVKKCTLPNGRHNHKHAEHGPTAKTHHKQSLSMTKEKSTPSKLKKPIGRRQTETESGISYSEDDKASRSSIKNKVTNSSKEGFNSPKCVDQESKWKNTSEVRINQTTAVPQTVDNNQAMHRASEEKSSRLGSGRASGRALSKTGSGPRCSLLKKSSKYGTETNDRNTGNSSSDGRNSSNNTGSSDWPTKKKNSRFEERIDDGDVRDDCGKTSSLLTRNNKYEPGISSEDITNRASSKYTPCANRTESSFSTVGVGFEAQISPPLEYFLSFEDIATVLGKTLLDVENSEGTQLFDVVGDIYDNCRNVDFNRQVLCHKFLNHEKFLRLMQNKTKFIVKNPRKIVQDMLFELKMQ